MLVEGATFAAYEVQRRLAVGGMGEVYLCRHRMLNRLDAVKVLRPHLARTSTSGAGSCARRCRWPGSSTATWSPSTPPTRPDGLLYLAMEYVAGEDLAALLERERRLDPLRVVALLTPVADALDTAHAAQLVHRDVKPSNLLVTAPGTSTRA
jgi:serine/threonine-protein kinase